MLIRTLRAARPQLSQLRCASAVPQTSPDATLKETLTAQIPQKQEELKQLKADHGSKVLGEVTVDQCIGGGRGVRCMLWETSLLDAAEGIRFRGYTIPECQELLPTFKGPAGDGEPTPEAILWLLLTGEIPTKEQCDGLTAELFERSALPAHATQLLDSLPKTMHPMTQFALGLQACQTEANFARAYSDGVHKSKYWESTYEDVLDVIAKLAPIAARVYRNTYFNGDQLAGDTSLDYSANFCRMLGMDSPGFDELMRLYLVIHSDHEGGNASAHTCHLVGSTLSDPYLSLSASMNALAGPLHGLAHPEVLGWLLGLQKTLKEAGKPVTKESITEFAWETLKAGKVIPGYGHAVLRKTDPRYTSQREFALKHLPDDELFHVVNTVYEVMPGVLTEHGKTKNPYPNVDSHSGVLLEHYGFEQYEYYTVLFGLGRAFGVLAQLFWDRGLNLPLERPKSVTSEWIHNFFEKNPEGLK